VRECDVVMVHASLRALGPVEGGAVGVIDAVLESVGPLGTMVMTLGARDDWAWVNERPEPDRPASVRAPSLHPLHPLRHATGWSSTHRAVDAARVDRADSLRCTRIRGAASGA